MAARVGWRFTKNVELHLISSAFGLATSARRPHPPRLRYFLRARFLLGKSEHLLKGITQSKPVL
jgi:hypothetical protein